MIKSKTEVAQLNFFRGFAALFVLIGHTAHITQTSLKPIPGPGHAVDFFMMMSGFLMALNFHERSNYEPWGNKKTIIKFYLRRFFRIAPVYYFFFFIVVIFLNKMNAISTIRIDHTNPSNNGNFSINFYFATILLHITFLFGLFPVFVQDNILPDWSIGLEMQFYAIFPFLMLLIKKIGRIFPVILCTILYLSSSYLFGSYNTPGILLHFGQPSFIPLKINIFLLGIFLGEAKYYINQNEESKAFQLLFLTLILSFIGNDPIIMTFCFYFIIWIFSMLKLSPKFLTSFFDNIEKKLDNNFTTFFANTSFSVYLLHLIVLYSVNAYFVNHDIYSKTNPIYRFILLLVICLPFIYFISYFVYKFIEYPFIKIGRKIIDSIYQIKN